jgi:hypothetical protein
LEVPTTITQQGRIILETGSAAEGVYLGVFQLKQGATVVWQQTIDAIELNQGFYSVVLGPNADASFPELQDALTSTPDLALAIQFHHQTTGELAFDFPAGQVLTAVPFAVASKLALDAEVSRFADEATHSFSSNVASAVECAGCIGATHISADSITSNHLTARSVTTGKLDLGAVDNDRLGEQSVTPNKVLGGLYSDKEQVSRNQVSMSLPSQQVLEVSASCPNTNDLALFGECQIGGLLMDVRLLSFGFSSVNTKTQAATYTCAFRNSDTSAVTITARIYCIPSNN